VTKEDAPCPIGTERVDPFPADPGAAVELPPPRLCRHESETHAYQGQGLVDDIVRRHQPRGLFERGVACRAGAIERIRLQRRTRRFGRVYRHDLERRPAAVDHREPRALADAFDELRQRGAQLFGVDRDVQGVGGGVSPASARPVTITSVTAGSLPRVHAFIACSRLL
jgi:hypothetical protein